MKTQAHIILLIPLLFASCRATLGPGWRAVATYTASTTDLEAMADELAQMDVVFLGEEHDNDVGHELQLQLTELLLERRGEVVVSLEMFERDAQDLLDLYLRGAVDEAEMLEGARPWPNYQDHYRPVVELAREHGMRVLAANCYRPLAARVAKRGRWSVVGEAWGAASVNCYPGPYRDKFNARMGEHASDMGAQLDLFFAAQCLKDDTMAESIARVIAEAGEKPPLVVHLCGRFHSDEGLGTVERLRSRMPNIEIGTVTMISGGSPSRDLTDEELRQADYVWRVPSQ